MALDPEDELELLRLKEQELRLRQQQQAPEGSAVGRFARRVGSAFLPAPSDIPGRLSNVGRTIRSYGQGAIPFYADLTAAARANIDPSVYGEGRDWRERFQLAREQERDAPVAGQLVGALTSPLNRLGPVTQGTGALRTGAQNLGQATLRNMVEGAGYGLGEGATAEQRLANAVRGALTAGATTAPMDVTGRMVGRALDAWQLPQRLRTAAGEFAPMWLSNPRAIRSGIWRTFFGALPGANELARTQEEALIDPLAQGLQAVRREGAEEAGNLGTFFRHAENDIDYARAQQQAAARSAADAQNLANQRAYDDAVRAQDEAYGAAQQVAAQVDDVQAELPQLRQDFRLRAARRALPTNASEELTALVESGADPRTINKQMGNEWASQGFNYVKGRDFIWPEELSDALKLQFAGDAALRNNVTDPLRRVVAARQKLDPADLEGVEAEDLLDTILRPGEPISGDLLMELRNMWPRGQGRAGGLRAAGSRKIANTFDEAISGQLSPDESSRYFADLDAWAARANYRGAVGSAAKKKQGMFDEGDWLNSGNPRLLEIGEAPLQEQADAVQRVAQTKAPKPEAVPKPQRPPKPARVKPDLSAPAEQARLAKRDLKLARDTAKEQQKQRVSERAAPVEEALQQYQQSRVRDQPSPYAAALARLYMPFAAPAGAAATVTQAGAGTRIMRPGVQDFFAGQGRRTRALADAIRQGRTEYVTRAVSRAAAQAALDEEQEIF